VDRLPLVWGATPAEHQRAYPADSLVADPVLMTRAVSVGAPVEVTWRWLCQLAVAPYSYDWIDNRGRRSPRELTPGAERLDVGQTMVEIFRLTSVDSGHQWTGLTNARGERLFGPVAVTYAAEPAVLGSRIVCRIVARGGTRARRAKAYALVWGDLLMMRKELLTLKELAERDAGRGTPE
jgi:hypothetical protein